MTEQPKDGDEPASDPPTTSDGTFFEFGIRRDGTARLVEDRRTVTPMGFIVGCMLAEAMGRRMLARLTKTRVPVCLCATVPDATWENPLREAAENFARPLHLFFRDVASRRPADVNTVENLISRLHRGQALLCASQNLKIGLPRAFQTVADMTIDLKAPTPEVVAATIAFFNGGRSLRRLPTDLGHGLDLQELAACIRTGEGPRRTVMRIRQAQDGKMTSAVDVTAPRLQDLAGYGRATEWGLRLAEDLTAFRNGTVHWRILDSQAILHGAPGTGKSLFARALARSCNLPLVVTSVGDWVSSYGGDLGGTVKAAAASFEQARAAVRAFGAAVLFIDEIDSLPDRAALDADRGSWWRPLVNFVLATLDGAGTNLVGVVLIAATNDIGAIDPALLRPGRFGTHLALVPPDLEGLASVILHHLGSGACLVRKSELMELLRPLAGATPASAAGWAKAARARAKSQGREVELGDIAVAALPTDERSDQGRRRAAAHEAGHAVVGSLLAADRLLSTSIVETSTTGGVTIFRGRDESSLTRSDIEVDVVMLLAGRAADVVVGDGASAGAGGVGRSGLASDLAQATARLTAVHASFGMGPTLRHRGEHVRPPGLWVDPDLSELIEADLQRLMRRAEMLITERADTVRAVAEALLAKRFLTSQEISDIIEAAQDPKP